MSDKGRTIGDALHTLFEWAGFVGVFWVVMHFLNKA